MLRLLPRRCFARSAGSFISALVPFHRYTAFRPNFKAITVARRWQSSAVIKELDLDLEAELTTSTRATESPLPTDQVVLRPYQETAITACLDALESGLTRIGVSSPTGSGKTTMFMSLIPKILAQQEKTRTLILVGSVELASQAEGAAKRLLGPDWSVEVEQGKRTASGTADV
jgi:superfamily II DNA or RNA helicase